MGYIMSENPIQVCSTTAMGAAARVFFCFLPIAQLQKSRVVEKKYYRGVEFAVMQWALETSSQWYKTQLQLYK